MLERNGSVASGMVASALRDLSESHEEARLLSAALKAQQVLTDHYRRALDRRAAIGRKPLLGDRHT